MIRSILFLFLIFGFNLPFFAQGGESLSEGTANTYALVVGVSKYESPDIQQLDYAHIDAQKFADYLHSPAGGNVPSENIHLLLNEEAKFGEFAKELTWLIKTAKEGDRAIIFFSGHAMVENEVLKKGYLQLYNSNTNLFSNNAFAFDDLNRAVALLNSKDGEQGVGAEVILIFDACRSGTIKEEAAALQIRDGFENTIRLLSCQPDQDSEEGKQWGGGRGAFSYHLVEGLVGKADQNNDTEVTLLELMAYLTTTVPNEVKEQQVPLIEAENALKLSEPIAFVDPETLAQLNENQEFKERVISRSKKKGKLDVIEQADGQIQEWYSNFEARLDENKLLSPEEDCAEFYYSKLVQQKELESLYSYLSGNYAAVLQDATVAIYKKITDADSLQQAKIFKEDPLFLTYPKYLNRAIELLGPEHYMHQTLTARKLFFEGLIGQIKYQEDGKRKEDLFAAIENQTSAIKMQPDNAHAYAELGELYCSLKDYNKAIEYLNKAIELSPEFAWAYHVRGGVYYELEKWESAKSNFENALKFAPDNIEYQSVISGNIALAATQLDQLEEATQWMERAMEHIEEVDVGHQVWLYSVQGDIYFLSGGWSLSGRKQVFSGFSDTSRAKQAIPAYQKAKELGNCEANFRIIEIMVKLQRPAKEIDAAYDQFIQQPCADEQSKALTLFYMAGYYYNDPEKGMYYFNLLSQSPFGEEYTKMLVQFITNNTSASTSLLIPYFKYFLEIDPNMPWLEDFDGSQVATLGDILDERMRENAGFANANPLIPVVYQYYPEKTYPYAYAKYRFSNRKEWKKEAKRSDRFSIDRWINWWQQMIEARPDVAVHYFQLATILYEWKRYGEAETYARKYYELEKEEEVGIQLLWKVLKKNGKNEEAKTLLNQ